MVIYIPMKYMIMWVLVLTLVWSGVRVPIVSAASVTPDRAVLQQTVSLLQQVLALTVQLTALQAAGAATASTRGLYDVVIDVDFVRAEARADVLFVDGGAAVYTISATSTDTILTELARQLGKSKAAVAAKVSEINRVNEMVITRINFFLEAPREIEATVYRANGAVEVVPVEDEVIDAIVEVQFQNSQERYERTFEKYQYDIGRGGNPAPLIEYLEDALADVEAIDTTDLSAILTFTAPEYTYVRDR